MRVIKGLFTTALSVLIAVMLMEISIFIFHLGGKSIVNPVKYPGRFIPYAVYISPSEGYAHRTINRYGFADRDYDLEKDGDINRGILLGTSMSEAFQVHDKDVYDNILEDRLSKNGKKFEIWNLAKSEGLIIDNLYLYKKLADTVPHKFVILQINPGNLYTPLASVDNIQLRDDKLVAPVLPQNLLMPLPEINQVMKDHSYFWNAVLTQFYHWQRLIKDEGYQTFFSKSTKDQYPVEPKLVFTDSAKMQLQKVLSLFASEVSRHHARLFVFVYALPGNPEADNVLKAICRQTGIYYLDIRHEVTEANKKHLMRGFLNARIGRGHLNVYGHKVIADILYNKLSPILNP